MKLDPEEVIGIIARRIEVVKGNTLTSKSQKMKELYALGLDITEIAKALDVSYNFVYNVVSTNIKKQGTLPVSQSNPLTKKAQIIKMFTEGKTNKEIAIALRTNYNYVYKITRVIRDTKKEVACNINNEGGTTNGEG